MSLYPFLRRVLACFYHRILGLFPQGERKEADSLVNIKAGAAYLALKTQTPILPVIIEGADLALPRWIRPVKIRIRVGRLISGREFFTGSTRTPA